MFQEFIPKSYHYLKSGYSFAKLQKDLIAGLTVGIVALPLSMGFAIASGTTPDKGLITAIIAGFLISAIGGSRVQIGGPTGAFVVVIYGIISRTGYEGLALSTLIAAILLILIGLFRLGSWIKYVPHPLITGFTTGIALTIFSMQIKDLVGLKIDHLPANFLGKWSTYFNTFSTFDPTTALLGLGTLGVIIFIRKFAPKIPWSIAAIVFSTVIVYFFNLDVETIQSKFGQTPNHLPLPAFPSFSLLKTHLPEILFDALAIAFLGGIEALLSAVIADGMVGTRHQSNCELVGQGIANFASIIFGGIPATGALARTALNVKSGAQSPIAGMIHAVVLFFIVLFFSPLVSQIPLASLAAILVMIAWNMSELEHFVRLLSAPRGDVAILVTTFLLTVFTDLVIAISVGMILASFLFMKKMSGVSKTVELTKLFNEPQINFKERLDTEIIENKKIPKDVEVYEIQGPFFFGAADILQDLLVDLEKPPKVFILRMRNVPFIDASGMHALKEFYYKCLRHNTVLLLSGIQGQSKKDLKRLGLTNLVGEEHIFSDIHSALNEAEKFALSR